jgi:hypothetical protein
VREEFARYDENARFTDAIVIKSDPSAASVGGLGRRHSDSYGTRQPSPDARTTPNRGLIVAWRVGLPLR